MSINIVLDPFLDNKRFWVKYSIVTPQGLQEIRSVSFCTMQEAKTFHKNLTLKIKQNA